MLSLANDIRGFLIDAVRKEMIGPDLGGRYVDYYKKRLNLSAHDELLLRDPHGAPWERYIAGKLYPSFYRSSSPIAKDNGEVAAAAEALPPSEQIVNVLGDDLANSGIREEISTADPIGLANIREPSSFGFTVMLRRPVATERMVIHFKCAFYKQGEGTIEKLIQDSKGKEGNIHDPLSSVKAIKNTEYWVRKVVEPKVAELRHDDGIWDSETRRSEILWEDGGQKMTVYITRRGKTHEGIYTLTFNIVNESKDNSDNISYQNEMSLEASPGVIVPYHEKVYSSDDQDDERQMQLLYRKSSVFGIGHGCSLVWDQGSTEVVDKVSTDFLPVFSVPLVAPGPDPILDEKLDLAMWNLSDKGDWSVGQAQLKKLSFFYNAWIEKTEQSISHLPERYHTVARSNIEKCRQAHLRIQEGIDLLTKSPDKDLLKSFRWMNRAMLWQQQRSKAGLRKWVLKGKRAEPEPLSDGREHFEDLEVFHDSGSALRPTGRWRPFQLAFILMNLKSMVEPESSERKIVDLIWFPTGGGKTEAYLGLTAYSIFLRRLKNREDSGTAVLMRYTLRLLTSQQFERAASLMVGCDLIAKEQGLQNDISIGLWVGGETTPNTNNDAVAQYRELSAGSPKYNFVLLKCPCCGVQLGPTGLASPHHLKGLFCNDERVVFVCENKSCEYHSDRDEDNVPSQTLPVYVVDDEIFESTPTLVIGTVDKFAMIPWKSQGDKKEKISRLFGFRERDKIVQRVLPPELIIQDELHLIAGPLGSMVGMYETLVQTLCNHYLRTGEELYSNKFIPPKIVVSSATITRAGDQISNLYGTSDFQLFPAQGIDIGDTWFSYLKRERSDNGLFFSEGRNYVGIVAPGRSAQQTIYKIYAAVYQAVFEALGKSFPNGVPNLKNADYYWTLIGYFNSIRELGGALTLVNGNFAEYLNRIRERRLLLWQEYRLRSHIQFTELTSRIPGHKIPGTLKKLETALTNTSPSTAIDLCLATNMIATGLDVSRLGMMFVHGQPKTTAEYIQASSRVGRQFWEGPGLVFTMYSSQKPRDKSIYEHFQSYHSRLYAHVEPTSVTPYSINVRDRALHAVVVGLVRSFSRSYRHTPEIQGGYELDYIFDWIIEEVIKPRLISIGLDQEDKDDTIHRVRKIQKRWQQDIYKRYGDAMNMSINNDSIQIRRTFMASMNAELPQEARIAVQDGFCIPTPTSMRGVDGECILRIPLFQ